MSCRGRVTSVTADGKTGLVFASECDESASAGNTYVFRDNPVALENNRRVRFNLVPDPDHPGEDMAVNVTPLPAGVPPPAAGSTVSDQPP